MCAAFSMGDTQAWTVWRSFAGKPRSYRNALAL